MAQITGREELRAYLRSLPAEVERKLLRGAGRAGAEVVADEWRARVPSDEVRAKIDTKVREESGSIRARVFVRPGWASSVAIWLEYGTDPHFISVDPEQSGGRTAGRVNRLAKEGVLVINGQPVGQTVLHPGARPNPTMRESLDAKEQEAVAAAQSFINSRVTRRGIIGDGDAE